MLFRVEKCFQVGQFDEVNDLCLRWNFDLLEDFGCLASAPHDLAQDVNDGLDISCLNTNFKIDSNFELFFYSPSTNCWAMRIHMR